MSFSKEKQQKGRDILLKEVLGKTKSNNRTMLLLPTSTGKTYIGFRALLAQNGKPGSLRIWVYEVGNIEGMYQEIKDRGLQDLFTSIEVVSYASSSKKLNPVDMEMFDEIHRGLGEKTLRNHDRNKNLSKYKVFTTATLKETEIYKIEKTFGKMDTIYTKTLDEVIDMGIVPTPNIVILRVDPDDTKRTEEVKYGKKKFKVTQKQKLQKITKDISYWINLYEESPTKSWMKTKFLRLGGSRMSYMADIKTNVAEALRDIIPDRKIFFCGSVKQAKKIGGTKHTLSSKEKNNEEKLARFNNKEIDLLTVKQKAKEGTNLVDTQTGVIIQIGNQEREIIQMTGRVLRHPKPVVFLIVLNDKKDKNLLEKNLNTINYKYVIGDYQVGSSLLENKKDLETKINRIYNKVLK